LSDAHVPLLQTYALIRTAPNVVLVFGGGIGDAESSLPYLTGSWSLPFFKPPMPVDGLLYGSRVMVAAEAPTDPKVKELIVNTPGVATEKEWEQSLSGVAGGVVTVQSELGEAIHKVATRGILFWKEMDEKYFSIQNKDQLKAALMKNKNYIIGKLNDDFQKPYCQYHTSSRCPWMHSCMCLVCLSCAHSISFRSCFFFVFQSVARRMAWWLIFPR
jgi:enoyl reductase-like protein